jgi:hypothetical protein
VTDKKVNRLAGLVKGASSDLAPEVPIRRGRGLEGMIKDETEALPDMSTIQQVNNTAIQQTSKTTSKQVSKGGDDTPRTVKSYRIRDDLAYRIDVLAATERRKIYEVIEEALDLYLRARDEEQGAQA